MPVDNFPKFAQYVAASFDEVCKNNPFVTDAAGDALYTAYLEAFPPGTNPVFLERTEHDCSCCKNFIRRIGAVVNVQPDGSLRTVWDEASKFAPEPYRSVAIRLRRKVLDSNVVDLFRVLTKEVKFGAAQTRSLSKDGRALTWNHFYTNEVPKALRVNSPDEVCGAYRTTVQVFERGLKELTQDALDTTLSLIDANALYRGAEHRPALVEFMKAKKDYEQSGSAPARLWLLAQSNAARFRNTVIGTLVQDLSEGKEVEYAVKAFETKVAPQNYKRTSAIITPAMVKKAMETVDALGLEPALERRFARIEDVNVRDVLWVDAGVKPLMKGGITSALMEHAAKAQPAVEVDADKAEKVSLDDFLKKVLPESTAVEVLFKNEHVGNLMSLTAPVHPEPKQLFKWTNAFAWSYSGNIADSIKERVKKAGGNVTNAKLRVSLSWFNTDDLDLHIVEPSGRAGGVFADLNGPRIYFGTKAGKSGGVLDVDMNAGGRMSREPVENVSWSRPPPDGWYQVLVHNFAPRERDSVGFTIEIETGGKLSQFHYEKPVAREYVHVCSVSVVNGQVSEIKVVDKHITSRTATQEKWGLKTEQFVKVNAVTFSPNYWGEDAVGNKHAFLVLDGARNDEPTRGIYNEFLHPRLEQHRKVFEVIGDKTKCQPTDGQLSGLGFSTTKPDSFIVRVAQGRRQRVLNVQVAR
jgi:hypothetical protein